MLAAPRAGGRAPPPHCPVIVHMPPGACKHCAPQHRAAPARPQRTARQGQTLACAQAWPGTCVAAHTHAALQPTRACALARRGPAHATTTRPSGAPTASPPRPLWRSACTTSGSAAPWTARCAAAAPALPARRQATRATSACATHVKRSTTDSTLVCHSPRAARRPGAPAYARWAWRPRHTTRPRASGGRWAGGWTTGERCGASAWRAAPV